jgi:hypothetical protein
MNGRIPGSEKTGGTALFTHAEYGRRCLNRLFKIEFFNKLLNNGVEAGQFDSLFLLPFIEDLLQEETGRGRCKPGRNG